jgi:hypothetical protein
MAPHKYDADAKYLWQEYGYTARSAIGSRKTKKLSIEVTVIMTA